MTALGSRLEAAEGKIESARESLQMLLEAQADPNRDHPQSGYTPLMLSCILDRPDVAETLVRARVDPSVRNK